MKALNRTLNRVLARLKPLAAAAVALALLSGCALAPTYQRPASPVAQHWDAEGQAGAASAPGSAGASGALPCPWIPGTAGAERPASAADSVTGGLAGGSGTAGTRAA